MRISSYIDDAYFKSGNYKKDVINYFREALRSDCWDMDITSKVLFRDGVAEFHVISKSDGIFAGVEEMKILKPFLPSFKIMKADGDRVKKGDILLRGKDKIISILGAERVLLNLIQHMSGIATYTQDFVKLAGKNVLICPTRKTLLGAIDKRACMVGGAGTHRINLNSAVLIKKNHAGLMNNDYLEIFNKFQNVKTKFIEIEISAKTDLNSLIKAYKKSRLDKRIPFCIMLDNFSVSEGKKTIQTIRKLNKGILIEISGGINERNIKKYSAIKPDIISIGKLTHSASALDFSMLIQARS